jgi:putative Holliday junction resolvase
MLLALDHSRAATGIALAEIQLGQARPLTVLRERDEEARLDHLAQLIQEWQPVSLIIGLPLNEAGEEQAQSKRVRKFAAKIETRFKLPLFFHDERWSTAAAEADLRAQGANARALSERGDAEAAREIMQGFLDAYQNHLKAHERTSSN